MNIRPLANRLVVKMIKESTTAGGIILPDRNGVAKKTAKVLSVGPGKRMKNGTIRPITGIQVDDIVLVQNFAGIPLTINGEDIVVIMDDDVVGKIEQ